MITKKRNGYLDFFRGCATISVMLIHTAFHSGATYVPYWFANITLLFDVPVFFFLAGWTLQINTKKGKNDWGGVKASVGLWCKWAFFVFLVELVAAIVPFMSGFASVQDLIQALCFFNFTIDKLPSVAASIWFVPVYIVVTFWGTILVSIWKDKSEEKLKNTICYSAIVMCIAGILYSSFGGVFFYMSGYFWFYLCFYLLGYSLADYRIKKWSYAISTIGVVIVVWYITAKLCGLAPIDLQGAKFPPRVMYLAASLLSIIVIMSLKGRIDGIVSNNKYVNRIGRNAIWFYYTQGIGASVLYLVKDFVPEMHWFLKWLFLALVNIVITIILAELILGLYKILGKVFSYFKQKFLDDKSILEQM